MRSGAPDASGPRMRISRTRSDAMQIACRSREVSTIGYVYYLVTMRSARDRKRPIARAVPDSGGCTDEKDNDCHLSRLDARWSSQCRRWCNRRELSLPCPRRRRTSANSADPARPRFQQRFVDRYQILSFGRTDQGERSSEKSSAPSCHHADARWLTVCRHRPNSRCQCYTSRFHRYKFFPIAVVRSRRSL